MLSRWQLVFRAASARCSGAPIDALLTLRNLAPRDTQFGDTQFKVIAPLSPTEPTPRIAFHTTATKNVLAGHDGGVIPVIRNT